MVAKAQPKATALQNTISELRKKYKLDTLVSSQKKDDYEDIVDIMTFCESPLYLNLPLGNFTLWISQRVVLKTLYMGTVGNENTVLTKEELDWLEGPANYFPEEHRITLQKIRERLSSGERFSELTLVLGRRSSKTILSSIISAYEIYKLLRVRGGDPYSFYKIPYGQEIAVLNVATSFKQAKRLYSQIQARLDNSPFFQNRIAVANGDEIRIYTDYDLKKLQDPNRKIKNNGSIAIVCGHSNPESLRGYACICIIFDELGFYDESAKISGKAFYDTLKPSVAQFAEKGLDAGMLVEISSPGPKTGVFYKCYRESLDLNLRNKLSFRMPTWIFNPQISYDNPMLREARMKDTDVFDIEYGAMWPEGTMFGKYFPEELIDRSLIPDLLPDDKPIYGREYYIHIDPAQSGNRYALAVVRREFYKEDGGTKLLPRVILCHTKVWDPHPSQGLNYMEIDREVLEICKRYHPVMVTYDTWNSISSTEFLKSNGINCMQTTFNRGYKAKIYQNLKELMARPSKGLWLYDEPLLTQELRELSWRPTARSISIGANPKSDCPTDDLADCLAGAAFLCCGHYYKRLPQILTVHTGFR